MTPQMIQDLKNRVSQVSQDDESFALLTYKKGGGVDIYMAGPLESLVFSHARFSVVIHEALCGRIVELPPQPPTLSVVQEPTK